jgi:hypothetical protein
MKQSKPLRLKSSLPLVIGASLFYLTQVVPLIAREASANLTAPPENNCLTQAVAQINKVRYVGKNSTGDDEVAVEWLVQSVSECVPFGSGQAVAGKENITPFGYEITVKIKRRLGNEDSGKVTKREIVKGTNTTIVRIPREKLETDPVSFAATLKTTAGAVQTFNRVVTGVGIPSLAGATQSTNKHSTVASLTSCFSSVDVSAINFIPGAGATPDNVTVNWGANTPASPCFEQPRFSIEVRVRRANGITDKSQTTFSPGSTSATLQLSGLPGGVTNFSVVLTAISGNVVEKSDTQSGNF